MSRVRLRVPLLNRMNDMKMMEHAVHSAVVWQAVQLLSCCLLGLLKNRPPNADSF